MLDARFSRNPERLILIRTIEWGRLFWTPVGKRNHGRLRVRARVRVRVGLRGSSHLEVVERGKAQLATARGRRREEHRDDGRARGGAAVVVGRRAALAGGAADACKVGALVRQRRAARRRLAMAYLCAARADSAADSVVHRVH